MWHDLNVFTRRNRQGEAELWVTCDADCEYEELIPLDEMADQVIKVSALYGMEDDHNEAVEEPAGDGTPQRSGR